MSLRNKKIMLLIVFVASITTIVGTISYAYFTSSGVSQNQDASLQTGSMVVRFADNDSGLNQKLEFGQTVTKKFMITNSGTLDAFIRLGWKDLLNTYTEGSLTYKLSYSEVEDGEYTEVLPKTNIPRSDFKGDYVLLERLEIQANTTYYCNLDITLNYLEDVNQDADLDAVFKTMFSVADVTTPVTLQISFDAGEGATPLDTKTVTKDLGYGELPKATRNGYAFGGWYTSETGGIKVTSSTTVTNSSSHKLYARWIEIGSKQTLAHLRVTAKTGNPNFDKVATTNEGVYSRLDSYGTSYYYRGAVENNYVKFGKNKAGLDMYWRIIRINGDGSLRMIYDGTNANGNTSSNLNRIAFSAQWNSMYDDAKYLGYMYGGANGVASTSKAQAQTNETDSIIKTQLETWYKENIVDTGYSEYISDEIFCNDRSTPGKSVSQWTEDTGLGYARYTTAYGPNVRFIVGFQDRKSNPNPIFTCPQKNDAFTVSDTVKGNGALTYPVGLITADEIVAAGGSFYTASAINKQFYLFKGVGYWTFSPYHVAGNGNSFMTVYYKDGYLFNTVPNDRTYGVAPVINISAEHAITLIGTGTMTDPYRLSTGQF